MAADKMNGVDRIVRSGGSLTSREAYEAERGRTEAGGFTRHATDAEFPLNIPAPKTDKVWTVGPDSGDNRVDRS